MTPDPNTMVECRTDRNCGGSSVTSTIRDCCDHDIEPSGFAYTIPGIEGCKLCPVGKIVKYYYNKLMCIVMVMSTGNVRELLGYRYKA